MAVLGAGAEDGAYGDRAGGLGGGEFRGVQEVARRGRRSRSRAARGHCWPAATRSATAPRKGARPVPAAIMMTGVSSAASRRKASRQGWTRARTVSPGRSTVQIGRAGAAGQQRDHQIGVPGVGGGRGRQGVVPGAQRRQQLQDRRPGQGAAQRRVRLDQVDQGARVVLGEVFQRVRARAGRGCGRRAARPVPGVGPRAQLQVVGEQFAYRQRPVDGQGVAAAGGRSAARGRCPGRRRGRGRPARRRPGRWPAARRGGRRCGSRRRRAARCRRKRLGRGQPSAVRSYASVTVIGTRPWRAASASSGPPVTSVTV